MKETVNVHGTVVSFIENPKGKHYICLTDIARYKNPVEPKDVIKNWMRNRTTIEFLGLWETL
ncbi:MAG: KilA-N domain-containing protein, partial [Bacteroidales bacterium]|nr:KilA-N domain-containing protein [Bacteroidales bacterium]